MNKFILNNGNKIPALGLGTYLTTSQTDVTSSLKSALENGFSLIDTAEIYENEPQIGIALNSLKGRREDLFLTSKVWNIKQGYDNTMRAFEQSLKDLKTNYLDLYLVHWPFNGDFFDTWRAMENLYEQGVAKNIGVCNFHKQHLEKLFTKSNIIPAVNQIELHPYLTQVELRNFCNKHNIVVESWSPIAKGTVANDSVLKNIGKKYKKTAVQVVLRWHIQLGLVAIPKSVNPQRITQSIDIFDFKLSESEMEEICNLNKNKRFGPNPDSFN